MNTLRYAPIIRVSTEGQERKGESLRTQTDQIKQYTKSLGGIIPDNCWQYSGQEHATPDQERKKLDQLLKDSENGKFDAVIVADASRWSRDNLKSKAGLEVLRKNGVRFFVGTMEYDLFNPEHTFILGMSAEIGEFQARTQALKSITNRINRARRNVPSAGKLPYGRTYSETDGWGIDPQKKQQIEWAAKQYLDGVSIVDIAKTLGMNFTNLWKILNHRSGTEWEIRFTNEKLNIDETVNLTIPPLLDDETISRIKEQAAANKTYTHGATKHQYLLSRMIFCDECDYALMGQTNHNTKRYYRHPRHRKNGCPITKWVPAEAIEPAVLTALLKMFGDRERIEQAMKRATPDLKETEAMRDELAKLKATQADVTKQRSRLVKLVAEGTLDESEIADQINPIRERLAAIDDRIEVLETRLAEKPDPAQIKRTSKLANAVLMDALKNLGPKGIKKRLDAPYEKRRRIVERAFAGKDAEGRRLGVYVRQTDDPERLWTFEIRAVLDQIVSFYLPKDAKEGSFSLYLQERSLLVCRSLQGIPGHDP